MTREQLQARHTKCIARIEAYEDAIFALTEGGEKSFSLNTGQTVTTVTNENLKDLTSTYNSLLNLCATLNARLNGGSVIVRPAW